MNEMFYIEAGVMIGLFVLFYMAAKYGGATIFNNLKMQILKKRGYMIFNLFLPSGRKKSFVRKTDESFDYMKLRFKPIYSSEYVYYDEYDNPNMDFSAKNIGPAVKDGSGNEPQQTVTNLKKPDGSNNITPTELFNMTTQFFVAGTLQFAGALDDLPQLIRMCLIASAGAAAIGAINLMYYLGVLG